MAVATRRSLARRRHIGVDCLTLPKLAERLAGEALAEQRQRLASAAELAAAVRRVLQTPVAGSFWEVREHPATERALVDTHRRLGELDEHQLDAVAKSSPRAADIVAISRQVRRRLAAEGLHDERDLLVAATRLARSKQQVAGRKLEGLQQGSSTDTTRWRAPATATFGQLVLHLPQRLSSAELGLLAALSSAPEGLVIVAGSCGDEAADAPVAAAVNRLAGAGAWRPAAVAPPAPTRVCAAPEADEEVRIALRGVTSALRRGVPLERMAVLYGSNNPYARLLVDQLQAMQLPFNGQFARPLAESVLGRFLLGLLGLPEQRYSRQHVMAWLSSTPVRWSQESRDNSGENTNENNAWRPVPVSAWDRLSRRAGVIDGAAEWEHRLEAYCTNRRSEMERRGEDRDWVRVRIERELVSAENLRRFMADVVARGEEASGLRTWRVLAQWARKSIRDLMGGAEWRREKWPEHEASAAEAIEAALERLAGLDRLDPEPDLARFRRALEAELTATRGRLGRMGHGLLIGRVGVALGTELECVWLVGMAEGIFPGRATEDTLLGETERAAASDALLSPPARRDDDHRSFLVALAEAMGERTLSYPRGDLRRSADRLPSRWLLESAQGLISGAPTETQPNPAASQLTKEPKQADVDLLLGAADLVNLPVGAFSNVASSTAALRACSFPPTAQEHDLRLLLDHHDIGGQLGEHPLAGSCGPLKPAVMMLEARRSSDFTRFDGNLAGCEIADPSASGSLVSATQLETWATCPHSYFMRYLLSVEPIEGPERELKISPLERGDLVHTILDRFLREVLEAGAPSPATSWGTPARQRLSEIAEAAFAEREGQGLVGQRVFWRPERARIQRELLAFLEVEEQWRRNQGLVPWASEQGFGITPRQPEEEPRPPVEFPLGDGRNVLLRGAIDRLDRRADGSVVVTDYKTGRRDAYKRLGETPWAIYAGAGRKHDPKREALPRLQLPLYAAAARQMLGAKSGVIAGYWFVTERESFRYMPLRVDESVEAEARWTMAAICDGLAGGVFPAFPRPRGHPSHCDYCDADRHRAGEVEAQIRRKVHQPELLAWLRVGARELLPTEERQRLADGPPSLSGATEVAAVTSATGGGT